MAVAQGVAQAPAVSDRAGLQEQRIVLHGVSWETYERLMADSGQRRLPHFAYDRGVLEIVSPTPGHEEDTMALAAVVTAVAEELGVDHRPVGSTTYRRRGLHQGFEADSGFYIVNQRFSRDLAEIDPTVDPPPDLVVEFDVSHSSLNKLPIHANFEIPEIWRLSTERVSILVLDGGT